MHNENQENHFQKVQQRWIARVEELEKKLAESEKKIFELSPLYSRRQLEQKFSEALEVIRFYGDDHRWTLVNSTCCSSMLGDDHEPAGTHKNKYIAGRRAREFMKKYEVKP